MRRTISQTSLAVTFLWLAVAVQAQVIGPWHVDINAHRIVSRPRTIYEAGDTGVYVTCTKGVPIFSIRERDPIARKPSVKLQFGGDQSGMIVFVGKNGVIRTFNGLSRGKNLRVAVANAHDSHEIVTELLKGHSRLAWIVDTDPDGFDSLEVRTSDFDKALEMIGCAP